MKKFLSLVLALVMTMSLVTVSAGAKDFTDNSKINYKEAVDVLSAVKVVDGYTDGAFNPSNTLTRGAAAKIICNLILGPTTASALVADAAPYKDVPTSNVFAGYIAYCQKTGIISGYADGTFRPAATLTGYAFMKMLLGALGYDATIEAYTGANWSINVAKRALNIGLADDLIGDFNGVKAVTREEACLYALNTLKATMVEYDSTTNVSVNGATVTVGGSKAKEMAQGNIYKDNLNKKGLQFAEKYFTDLKLAANATDDFGRPANKWKLKGNEIGTYALKADATYSKAMKGKDIYSDLDKKAASNEIVYYVDGKLTPHATFALAKGNSDKVGAKGAQTEVFYDDDAAYYGDTVVTVATTKYYFAEVLGDYNTKDEEVTLGAVDSSAANVDDWTVSSDDVAGLESLKDGDYVLFTMAWNGSKYEIKTVQAVTPVKAAVTEYTVGNNAGDGSVTAGGTTYSYNATYNDNTRTYELKDEYNLYLDPFGNVIWADGVEAEGNYFFVTEYAKNGNLNKNAKVEAYVYTLEGKDNTVTLNKVDGVKATTNNHSYNSWASYRLKDDGKYDITTKTTVGGKFAVATAKAIENGKGGMTLPNASTVRVTNATIFVVNDSNDNVKVYTGIKNVPTIDAGTTTSIYAMKDGNYAKFVFVDLGNGHTKGGNNSDVLYILKNSREDNYSQDVDDNTYYTYKAILNGTETKVKVESTVLSIASQGLYTDVVYSSNNYIDDAVMLNTHNTAAGAAYEDDFDVANINDTLERKGDVLTTSANDVSFYLASGAQAIVIKANGDIDTITSARSLASNYKHTVLKATVYAVLNSDGEATTLYVQK